MVRPIDVVFPAFLFQELERLKFQSIIRLGWARNNQVSLWLVQLERWISSLFPKESGQITAWMIQDGQWLFSKAGTS